jgi:carboxyl-terminal processing protease
VFTGSPAEEAGLLPGDKILGVDGEDMTGRLLDEVTALVRGTSGTVVQLRLLRGDEIVNMTITRGQINIPTVYHNMLNDGIGFLRIESFDRVTMSQFSEAYTDLLSQNMRGLIIDLRNNPGGLLETVIYIGNQLLPEGPIMYSEDSRGRRTAYRSESGDSIDVPLVILVNGASASASEVLTGAVRDLGVGTVVGQQTFGKGVVQSLLTLSDGSAVKVTTAQYYTPSGVSIHGEGIIPDYIVEVDRETAMMSARLAFEDDVQLQKAVEVMLGKLG